MIPDIEEKRATGYIKLYRAIQDSAIWQKPELLKLWIWLLHRAAWRPREILVGNTVLRLERGQLVMTERTACARLGLGRTRLRNFIRLLEAKESVALSAQKTHRDANHVCTIVTIVNYELYADADDPREPQDNPHANQERTTSEPPANHLKELEEVEEVEEGGGALPPPSINIEEAEGATGDTALALARVWHRASRGRFPLQPTCQREAGRLLDAGFSAERIGELIRENSDVMPWDVVDKALVAVAREARDRAYDREMADRAKKRMVNEREQAQDKKRLVVLEAEYERVKPVWEALPTERRAEILTTAMNGRGRWVTPGSPMWLRLAGARFVKLMEQAQGSGALAPCGGEG